MSIKRMAILVSTAFLGLSSTLLWLLSYSGAEVPVAHAAGLWYVAPGGSDSNSCLSSTAPCATINGAIGKASGGDTIYVAIGVYTSDGSDVVFINKDVTLSGGWDVTFTTQDGTSTIDGEESRRGLLVNPNMTATVDNFIIQNGFVDGTGYGSGVYNGGTLTMSNCTVWRNRTFRGGGIYVSNYGQLILNNCSVLENIVDYHGGGIYVNLNGTLILNNSTINANRGDYGGGISSNNGNLTLNNSIISNNQAIDGGGIYDAGWMMINNSIVSDNEAETGGGIYKWQADLTISNSAITRNSAVNGGGIYILGYNVYMQNSTISGNMAENGAGIYTESTLKLSSITMSRNIAIQEGGGIYRESGNVTAQNSILAGNINDNSPDCFGDINTSGYNLIGDIIGCTFSPGEGDLTNIEANLGHLIAPSGTPWYHPLMPGSPAIDAGNLTGCRDHLNNLLSKDQREVSRVGRCDIGAYEYTTPGLANMVAAVGGTPQRIPPSFTFEFPLQAAVMDAIGSPVQYIPVTFTAPESGPSGKFADTGTFTTQAETTESGVVTTSMFTANLMQGSYTVTATVTGIVTPTHFELSNVGWYVATSGDDDNDCQTTITPCASINGALSKTLFIPGDTVLVATGIYTSAVEEVVLLDEDVSLSGGWSNSFITQDEITTVDGENQRRGMKVNNNVIATVERFTFQNGAATHGGGIHNSGELTLKHITVRNNAATQGGGGIDNTSGSTLTMYNSAIISNTRNGIGTAWGTLYLNNVTISGNTDGGINSLGGWVFLNNCTISDNTDSGILHTTTTDGGTVELQNTILSGNIGARKDCAGEINSLGYNLLGDTSECTYFSGTGDLLDTNPGLLPLPQGSPAYLPLLPNSPAIDAGNPTGCTDHKGNFLSIDQRGSTRPIDGNGDTSAICDIGSYEYDPSNPEINQVFLPCSFRNFCPDFFDDFSNPNSGWPVLDNEYELTAYLNGEYQVLTRQAGYFYLFMAPTCARENYEVGVDARWEGKLANSYGIIFGVLADFSQYYLFDMNSDYQVFRVLRRDSSGFHELVPVSYSSAIHGDTATNYLKVIRDGDLFTLMINGVVLGTWTDGTITGLTYVGIISSPYNDQNKSDARFDNFSVTRLPSDSVTTQSWLGLPNEFAPRHVTKDIVSMEPLPGDWWNSEGEE